MNAPDKRPLRPYTYRDYLTWTDQQRWEILNGEAFQMSPGPSRNHQRVLGVIFTKISVYLTGKMCEVYMAPFDLRLSEGDKTDEEAKTVVQPDIMVVCDRSKLDNRGCKGSPDLIIEVVSPGSVSMDYVKKLNLYERHGVREYWIVNPEDFSVLVYRMNNSGEYGKPEIFLAENRGTTQVHVGIFPNLMIDLTEVFCINEVRE